MVLAILTARASAVVILNTDGTANNGQTSLAGATAPFNTLPYANVGVKGTGFGSASGSVVYLGNDWAITAAHVNIAVNGNVLLNGQTLTVDKTQQIDNTSADGGSPADLELIHFTSDPGLPAVPIANSTQVPTAGSVVTLVGDGKDLGTVQGTLNGQAFYNLTPPQPSDESPRWGTNAIASGSIFTPNPANQSTFGLNQLGGSDFAYTFATSFHPASASATNQQAQVTTGDSGGGAFQQIGGVWTLVGLIDGLSSNVPPGGISADIYYGATSTMIDLAYYQSTIAPIIAPVPTPEPSSLVLGGMGAGIMLLAGLRARRQRQRSLPQAA